MIVVDGQLPYKKRGGMNVNQVADVEYLQRRVSDLETFVVSIDEHKAFHEYIDEYGETKERIDTGEEDVQTLPAQIEVSNEAHLTAIFQAALEISDEELEKMEIYRKVQMLSLPTSVNVECSEDLYCVEVTRQDGSQQAIYVDSYHYAVTLANELCSAAGLSRYTFSFCFS